MKHWIISYQYWKIVFADAALSLQVPDGFVVMDDCDISLCFARLTEGNNVWVCCRQGLMPVIRYCIGTYIPIKAAGGLVRARNTGNAMLIARNGHADLAKGKVEAGETLAGAALREVNEETGLQGLQIGRLALKTYHIYNLYGGWHLKQTSWFEMWTDQEQPVVPQTEEGIEQGEWLPVSEWRQRLSNSYSTMRDIAQTAFNQ